MVSLEASDERAFALAMSNMLAGASTLTWLSSVFAQSAISLHCWQGDDLGGFEVPGKSWAGGWR